MNPKIVLVGLASAAFAAGLTYWVVAPMRDGHGNRAMAKIVAGPAGPPVVISTAGPDPSTILQPSTPLEPVPWSKPSPIRSLATSTSSNPTSAVLEQPVVKTLPEEPVEPLAPAPPPQPQPQVITPASPAPPARVALNPPKEIDRAEPAVFRDRESRGPNTVTLDAGTMVIIRMGETLSVHKNLTGDTFFATLDQPLVAGGFVIAEKGARVEGKIVEVDKAGRLSGTSRMSLELTQLNSSDGQRVHLQTSTYSKDGADRNGKNDAAKIGGGAVLGAIIGAAAGGGKGAGIGAGAGGAAGAGAVLLSGGRNVTIPVETKLSFRVERPIIITERIVQ